MLIRANKKIRRAKAKQSIETGGWISEYMHQHLARERKWRADRVHDIQMFTLPPHEDTLYMRVGECFQKLGYTCPAVFLKNNTSLRLVDLTKEQRLYLFWIRIVTLLMGIPTSVVTAKSVFELFGGKLDDKEIIAQKNELGGFLSGETAFVNTQTIDTTQVLLSFNAQQPSIPQGSSPQLSQQAHTTSPRPVTDHRIRDRLRSRLHSSASEDTEDIDEHTPYAQLPNAHKKVQNHLSLPFSLIPRLF